MPLTNTSVVDCGQVLAGPLCGTFLADLGADVVKVEPPDGEMFRTDRRTLEGEPFNPGFELFNRNKRAVSLDLKTDEGREIIYNLVQEADIFIQNWPPGVAERLGVDYETLSEINDDIIYVHITGYGQSGPMTNLPGMDAMIQHVSGFSSMLGYEDDDRPPIRSQSSLADYFAAYNATISALGALIHRERVGGQKVDISLLESIAHNIEGAYEYYNNLDEVLSHGGHNIVHQQDLLYGAARAADGWVAVALLLYNDRMWKGYCEVLDRPDLLEDERYQDSSRRIADLERLTDQFKAWLETQQVDDAIPLLNEHGIPAAPYQTIDEAAEMDQMKHLGVFEEISHPRYGSLTLTSSPLSLSEADVGVEEPAPLQGQHNRDVLQEIGYGDDEIDALANDNVLSN